MNITVVLILESKKKEVTCSSDSVLTIFFAKCLLKVLKIQTIILGILSVSFRFNFKSDHEDSLLFHL